MRQTPFIVPVHDLINRPGTMRETSIEVTLDEELGNYAIAVPAGQGILVRLRLESVHEGIYVTGEVDTAARGECSRCLEAVNEPVEVDFQELFAYSGSSEDDLLVEGDQIDLEQAVRDAVVLSLPFQPVCSADCLGLCVQCGEKIKDASQHEHDATVDPRWSALKKLKED